MGSQPLTWTDRAKIALGTARGLSYLHNKNFLHLNIKASNVFLNENLEPKIGAPLSKDYFAIFKVSISSTFYSNLFHTKAFFEAFL